MSLPPDVLDHIFSFLQSDTGTLKACSQSHPTLSQLVERHLYVRITLYDYDAVDDKGLGTTEYAKLLIDRPYIVDYIRILEIKMVPFGGRHLDKILKMLPILFNLKKVTLASRESSPAAALAWAVLPKRFHLALLDCLHLPNMKELCINDIPDFPLSSLNNCNTIENLTLRGWAPDAEASSWPQMRNLHALVYDRCDSSLVLLSQLIESCSNRLTRLYIDFGHKCTPYSP